MFSRDRAAEQVALLGDHADRARDRRGGQVAHVVTVDRHRSALDVVEPRDQVGDRRLARPGRARPAPRAARARPASRRRAARPRAPAVRRPRRRRSETTRARARPRRGSRPRPDRARPRRSVICGRRSISSKIRPNSASDDWTSTDTCSNWLIGISSRRLQRRERHQRPRRQVAVGALEPGDQIDERRADPEERLGDGEERSADHRLADLQVGLVGVLDAVAVDLVLPGARTPWPAGSRTPTASPG